MVMDILVIIYGIKKQKDASIKIMLMLAAMIFVGIMSFFIGRMVSVEYELTPISYIGFQAAMLIIEARGMLYNFDETISDSLIKKSGIGYMAVDRNLSYLGANTIAKEWFPVITKLKLDQNIAIGEKWLDGVVTLIERVKKDNGTIEVIKKISDDKSIKIKADFFYYNKKHIGYIIWLEDVTIEQAYIEKVLYEKEHDLMTGLFNKGKYMELTEDYYRTRDSISIFIMDVNDLKKTNDTFGHEKGDELIIKASQSLHAVEKEKIKGFRLGGDEFMLFGEDLSPEETEQLHSDWENAVKKLNENDDGLNLVISCGISYGKQKYDLEQLMNEADAKMYKNKQYLKSLKK